MTTTRTGRRQRIAKIVTGCVVVLAVAGVALAGLPAWATGPTPDLPQKDVDAWVMPLDRYILVSEVTATYVESLQTIPCMAAAGYTWEVPKRDIEAASNHLGDVTVQRPLTAAVVQDRGYHPAPTHDPGLLATQELNARPISDAEYEAFVACLKKVEKVIPLPSWQRDQASQYAVALSNAAYDAAQSDGPVVAAARQWQVCMGGTFLHQPLPASPADMPSLSVADRFATNVEGSTVSQAERDLALKDVGCQATSGYRNALYEAEWKRQASVPKKDEDLFNRVGNANEAYRETVLAALARLQLAGN
ncbi:hypothetical protein G3T36_02465 [Diaminobutyricibacter tongyongensis]|uniref:Uncharacterized protein n=1 Tax=Leifsonia tongyongensis TaxID=1268043 RepID=A0A6L9XUH0_9MICO|nr:hypothetical protein [Diaminobutyricibacter tongyongensis]NEN04724.1 hypothetical protein [Diaminobutyricibacter tongyongensis]